MEEKTYTISEISKMMNIPSSTIRYYDSQGLLPYVNRVNGRRMFTESDISGLRLIECLKNTGMPIKDIKAYFVLVKEGDSTLLARRDIILHQKEVVKQQIKALERNLKKIEEKEEYYSIAIEAGTEAVHQKNHSEKL